GQDVEFVVCVLPEREDVSSDGPAPGHLDLGKLPHPSVVLRRRGYKDDPVALGPRPVPFAEDVTPHERRDFTAAVDVSADHDLPDPAGLAGVRVLDDRVD